MTRDQIDALLEIYPDAAMLSTFGPGEVVAANEDFLRRSGYRQEELLGRSVHQLQPWAQPADRVRYYLEICRTGHCTVLDTELCSKDGQTGSVSVIGRLISCDGRLCLLSFFQDISQRKRIEEALRASEERYSLAVKLARVGLWQWNPCTDLLEVEPFFASFLGMESVGSPTDRRAMMQLVHPDDRDLVRYGMVAYMDGESPEMESELRFLHADGSARWAVVRAHWMESAVEAGEIIVGTFTDITERKRAQLAYEETQGHLRSLMETAETFALFRLAYDDSNVHKVRVQVVSPSARDIIGVDDYQNMENWFSQIHPDDMDRVRAAHFRSFATKRFNEVFRTIMPKTGEVRWIHAIANSEMAGSRERWYANGVMHDITERKRVEEKEAAHRLRLREMAQELSRVEDQQRQRIAMDLHDGVGQMLAAAKMRLQALEADDDQEVSRAALAEVRRMLEETVAQIRSLTVELCPPVLYELGLHAALEWLGEEMTARQGMKVELRGAALAAAVDEGLASLLFRSVRELLHNVVKHADAAKVWIEVRRDKGGRISISVTDDGKGFSAEGEDQRPDQAGRFGLFSIRERLEYLGGRMEISSRPGWGTMVVLWGPPAGEPGLGSELNY